MANGLGAGPQGLVFPQNHERVSLGPGPCSLRREEYGIDPAVGLKSYLLSYFIKKKKNVLLVDALQIRILELLREPFIPHSGLLLAVLSAPHHFSTVCDRLAEFGEGLRALQVTRRGFRNDGAMNCKRGWLVDCCLP